MTSKKGSVTMKAFMEPEMEIETFSVMDIITLSTEDPNWGNEGEET